MDKKDGGRNEDGGKVIGEVVEGSGADGCLVILRAHIRGQLRKGELATNLPNNHMCNWGTDLIHCCWTLDLYLMTWITSRLHTAG